MAEGLTGTGDGRLKPTLRGSIPYKLYGRSLAFLRPHGLRFLPLFALSFFSSAVTLAQPYLTKLLIDDALNRHNMRDLWLLACWMGICAGLSFGFGMLTTYLYTKVSAAVLFDMRLEAFRKLQTLSPQYFARTQTGEIVSRLNNDISELQRLSSDTLLSLPTNVLFLIGSAVLMASLNWRMFLISVATIPLLLWAMRPYQQRLRDKVQVVRQQSARIGSFLIDAVLGMRLLVTQNAQERKNREFRGHNDAFVTGLLAMQTTSFIAGALPGAVLTLSVAGLFLYGGSLVIAGALSLGSLMAFMAYHSRLLSPVQSLIGSYSALITGSVSLRRVFELLDEPAEVSEAENAQTLAIDDGRVRFEEVCFSYRGRAETLHQVSFEIPGGSTAVIVGPSGSGKSTVADLLLRFFDPSAGRVSIDGQDLRDAKMADLRATVGIVDQTPFFFFGSIRENLLFAWPGAREAEYREACRAAGIDDFISLLPEGYETEIGERGLALSAGQRQRLAIARALLRKPKILVLDEPSSALDPAAEAAIRETLRALAGRCTLLIVTHRPALVSLGDQVIVVENGMVVEQAVPAVHLEAAAH